MPTSPPVLAVAHTGLTVPNLDEALSMWCDGLGFALTRTFALDEGTTRGTTGVAGSTVRAAVVSLGETQIELLEYDPAPAEPVGAAPSQSGALHVALTVGDIDDALAICRRHGWESVGPPHLMTSGPRTGTSIVYLHGPAGGLLELIAPAGS